VQHEKEGRVALAKACGMALSEPENPDPRIKIPISGKPEIGAQF
jgi:hypothetical protein